MARIKECQDVSEAGNLASLLEAGYVGLTGTDTAITTGYKDVKNNGGTYSLQLTGSFGSNMGTKLFQAPLSEFYWKMHWQQNFYQAGDHLLAWNKSQVGGGENRLGTLRIDAQNRLEIWVEGTGTPIATSINSLINGHWYLIEVHIKVAGGGTGKIEVRVNGSSVGWIPDTTVNTIPTTGDTAVDRIWLMQSATNNAGHRFLYDDWDCDTAGFIGESIITAHLPTADGGRAELTPSTGSAHWSLVDERPPAAADYNDALVVGQGDTYVVQDLPANVDYINKVVVMTRVVKAGAAISSSKRLVRIGGTDYLSPDAQTLPLAQEVHFDVFATNPATSAPWTDTGFNGAEFGIQFD